MKPQPTKSTVAKPGQLTAMISSTALDLLEHRDAVIQACLSADVFPIDMQHLPARDANGVRVSLEMVDKADIYIGILAWRYGWVPDFENPDGLSITEMEFDHAVERKKKGKLREILIFTAHEDHPVKKKDVEAVEVAQDKLAAFKGKAEKGRVRKEFSSVEELRRLVSEALQKLSNRQTTEEPGASTFAPLTSDVPHNLPSLQPFFGREDELKKIADALDPDSRTWGALIDGPGGMGKTSLAVRAAYEASPAAFERIVFVSLKTRELDDDGVRDLSGFIVSGLAELFGEVARLLGFDEIVKADEKQRPRLLLDALRGSRVLLVLDNLESLVKTERDTVSTFVKKLPTGCKAILTSRGRIGSGAEELILEKLSEDAALATLAELATHNPLLAATSEAERITLYRETAGKPLLLRWTAGQIGRGSCLTFTDALHYIRSCPPGNDPLEFIFGDLVEDFTDAETKAVCALSYFTLPAKVGHIATLAELPEVETDRALRRLVNRSIGVPSDEFQTFTLVPMVADFLRKTKPEVVAQMGDRLEKRAFALIVENGYQEYDRFPVLDAAWPTVAPALPRFLNGPNERLQTVCSALPTFLEFTGRWAEWQALEEQSETKAIAHGDYRSAGWRAKQVGWVYYLRGQADALVTCADRAAAHWKNAFSALNDAKAGTAERAIASQMRGLGLQAKDDFPSAIAALREAVELWRQLPTEAPNLGSALNSLANALKRSGDFEAAEQHYREALRVADDEGVANTTCNLADLALDRKDWSGAEILAREALSLCEKLGRQGLIASNCICLATAIARQERQLDALPYARRAVTIYTWLGSPRLDAARELLQECESE